MSDRLDNNAKTGASQAFEQQFTLSGQRTEEKRMQELLKQMGGDIAERIDKKMEEAHKPSDFLNICIAFLVASVEEIDVMEEKTYTSFISQCTENGAERVILAFADKITSAEFNIRPLRLLELCKALKDSGFIEASDKCLLCFEKKLEA